MPTTTFQLPDLLKDSNYKLTQFSTEQIEQLEESVFLKTVRGKESPYITCLVREKDIKLTPEEAVRQLYFQSFCLNGRYEFERAKRAVEIAVKNGKKAALVYLKGKHYVAEELLPKLFGLARHYVDLPTIQKTIEAEALQYEPATIKRYLQEWMREGRIHDAGRGWYSDLEDEFFPDPKIPILKSLPKTLKEEFPLLDYTMWSTRELIPFFHHLPTRHATFLMVDRDALDPVADALREAGHHVVVHPLGDAAKAFSLQEHDTIILRPRLSSDHNEKRSLIEHTLVDLFYEIQKLGLYELEEYHRLFQNLTSTNRINITALKRYAERRKIEPSKIIPFIG